MMETHQLPFPVSASWLFFTVCSALGAGPLNLRRVGGAAQLSQIRESCLFFTRFFFFLMVSMRGELLVAYPNCLKKSANFLLFSSVLFCFLLLPLFTFNCMCHCSLTCVSSPDRRRGVAQILLSIQVKEAFKNISKHTCSGLENWFGAADNRW